MQTEAPLTIHYRQQTVVLHMGEVDQEEIDSYLISIRSFYNQSNMNTLFKILNFLVIGGIAIVGDRLLGVHVLFLIAMFWWLNRAKDLKEWGLSIVVMGLYDAYWQLPLGSTGVLVFGGKVALDALFVGIPSRKVRYLMLIIFFNSVVFIGKSLF